MGCCGLGNSNATNDHTSILLRFATKDALGKADKPPLQTGRDKATAQDQRRNGGTNIGKPNVRASEPTVRDEDGPRKGLACQYD